MSFFSITFLKPHFFALISLAILLLILRKTKIFSRPSLSLTLCDWNGKIFAEESKIFRVFSVASSTFFLLSYIFFVCALAEPVMRKNEKIYTSQGAEILFVLDTSISMAAKDMSFMNSPLSRLDAAKRAIRTLLENSDGYSFALVTVASEAALVVPSTRDHSIFLNRLDKLQVGELGEGSALGTGLSSAIYHLAFSKSPHRAIILFSDGENNAGLVSPITAAQMAFERKIALYVLGLGTSGTAPLEYVDSLGKTHSVLYESSFDSEPLRKIAEAAQGKYFGLDSLSSLSENLSKIATKEKVEQKFIIRVVDKNFYSQFLLISGVFFLLSTIIRRLFLKEFF